MLADEPQYRARMDSLRAERYLLRRLSLSRSSNVNRITSPMSSRSMVAIAGFVLGLGLAALVHSFAQIDGESEAKIHEALRTFVKGRTTFLITHRRSTLELADRIVVMDGGRIVAEGKHAELLVTSSTYRRLYDSQPSEGKSAA